MKICHFCGNKNFKEKEVEYTYKRDDKYVIVDDVPCEQCEYCGEQYFEARVIKNIEKEFNAIHLKGKQVKKKVVIPVENYTDVTRQIQPTTYERHACNLTLSSP